MLACRRGSEHIPATVRNYADKPLRKPRSDGFDMLFTRLIWMQTCLRNHDPRHIKSGRDDQCRSPRRAIERAKTHTFLTALQSNWLHGNTIPININWPRIDITAAAAAAAAAATTTTTTTVRYNGARSTMALPCQASYRKVHHVRHEAATGCDRWSNSGRNRPRLARAGGRQRGFPDQHVATRSLPAPGRLG